MLCNLIFSSHRLFKFDDYLGGISDQIPCLEEASDLCPGLTDPRDVLTCLSSKLQEGGDPTKDFSDTCKAALEMFGRCSQEGEEEKAGGGVTKGGEREGIPTGTGGRDGRGHGDGDDGRRLHESERERGEGEKEHDRRRERRALCWGVGDGDSERPPSQGDGDGDSSVNSGSGGSGGNGSGKGTGATVKGMLDSKKYYACCVV